VPVLGRHRLTARRLSDDVRCRPMIGMPRGLIRSMSCTPRLTGVRNAARSHGGWYLLGLTLRNEAQ
jgi:hypothetical protein